MVKKFLFLCSMVIAFNATAEEKGFYVGGSLGYSNIGYDEDAVVSEFRSNNLSGSYSYETGDVAYKFYAGYDFNQHFGLEAGYVDLGEVTVDLTVNSQTVSITSGVTGPFVAALGRYPVNENSNIFGKIGVLSFDLEAKSSASAVSLSDDGRSAIVGGGYEYEINHIGVRLEVEHYFIEGDIEGTTLVSLGLEYDF